MEIQVGEYVRTRKGSIGKFEFYGADDNELIYFKNNKGMTCVTKNEIVKHSFNIIDLIEVGDYVNGTLVKQLPLCKNDFIYGKEVDGIKPVIGVVGTPIEDNKDGFVKSIVTKEQFESMKYSLEG